MAQAYDDSVTQEVTNHLFQEPGKKWGMDLAAINMQRGREQGIPGYGRSVQYIIPSLAWWFKKKVCWLKGIASDSNAVVMGLSPALIIPAHGSVSGGELTPSAVMCKYK